MYIGHSTASPAHSIVFVFMMSFAMLVFYVISEPCSTPHKNPWWHSKKVNSTAWQRQRLYPQLCPAHISWWVSWQKWWLKKPEWHKHFDTRSLFCSCFHQHITQSHDLVSHGSLWLKSWKGMQDFFRKKTGHPKFRSSQYVWLLYLIWRIRNIFYVLSKGQWVRAAGTQKT